MANDLRAHAGDMAEPPQPLLRKNTELAIIQPHHVFAPAQSLEQLRKLRRAVAISDLATQLKPVNSSGNLHLKGTGTAENFAFRFDTPSGFHQYTHNARELGRSYLPRWFWV